MLIYDNDKLFFKFESVAHFTRTLPETYGALESTNSITDRVGDGHVHAGASF